MKTLRRLSSLLILVLSFSPVVWSQALPTASPEEVGLSSERLDRLTSVMQGYVKEDRVAGGVGIILRRGKVAYHRSFGLADREASDPMETGNIFRIASMSKAITSVAVMMLFEEGHFMLDDPVSRYIPAFDRDMKVLVPNDGGEGNGEKPYRLEPAKRPITIRHLLNHTSGITYGFFGQEHISEIYTQAGISDGLIQTEGTIGGMVDNLAKQPLMNHPGEEWQYGLSTDVLGRLVEVVSGLPLDRFFRERIFEPLQMNDTYFFLPEEKVPRLAAVYTPDVNGSIERLSTDSVKMGDAVFSTTYHYKGPRTYYSGGAGLVSSASDYARFLQMLLNGGIFEGARILGPKTVQLMTSNQIGELNLGEGVKFTLGFALDLGPGRSGNIGSGGIYSWGGFFNTTFWVDPKEELVAILMTQLYPNNDVDILNKFRVMTYQAVID